MPEQLPKDPNTTPSYLDPQPDCVCGHEEADHVEAWEVLSCLGGDNHCACEGYEPKDAYYYEELRQEAELARWEDR